jgi:hypothetical protein
MVKPEPDIWATGVAQPQSAYIPELVNTPSPTLSTSEPVSVRSRFSAKPAGSWLQQVNGKHNLYIRLAEFALGGAILFTGVAYLAGHEPKFAAALTNLTGAKF